MPVPGDSLVRFLKRIATYHVSVGSLFPYGCAFDYSNASSYRPLGSSLLGSVLALVVFCHRTVNSKVRVVGTVTSREVRAAEGCFVALCVGEHRNTFPNMHAGATSKATSKVVEIADIIVSQLQHAPARFYSCGKSFVSIQS